MRRSPVLRFLFPPGFSRRSSAGRAGGGPWRGGLLLLGLIALGTGLVLLARAGRAAQRGDLGAGADLAAVSAALCPQLTPLPVPRPDLPPRSGAMALALAADVDVLGLGESTHGTHEFFAFKAAMIRALIEAAGVRTVAFEAPWRGAGAVDRFVRAGEGTARDALAALGMWPWSTEEVAGLLEWIREFNRARPLEDRVGFVGFDPQMSAGPARGTVPEGDAGRAAQEARVGRQAAQLGGGPGFLARYRRDAFMAENLLWIARHRTEAAPVVAWAHNGHLARSWPSMGRHLHRALGPRFRAVALLTGRGDYSALVRNGDGRLVLGTARLTPPPARAVEGLLAGCGVDGAFVWLDRARRSSRVLEELFEGRLLMRSVGAVADTGGSRQFFPSAVATAFDAVWFSDRSSPTRVVPLPGMRSAPGDG